MGYPAHRMRFTVDVVATERARNRCRERLELLARSNQDTMSVRREAVAELKRVIGFDRWCVPLVDPDSLVSHTGVAETDHIPALDRLQLLDARLGEPNTGAAIARRRDRVGLLSATTRGDLARSRRWRETLESYGTGDELRVVAADERGCWARFDLWRDAADPPFTVEDVQLLRDVSRSLGQSVRRATVYPGDEVPAPPRETGVLLVDTDRQVRASTPAVREWFQMLNTARVHFKDGLPSVVWSTVGRLLAIEDGEDPQRAVQVRVRGLDGRWAVVEAGRLDGMPDVVALTVHAAGPRQILDLFCRACGLTRREHQVVALVVDGLDTRAIAKRLSISHYTVQEHLQSAFGKLGVSSRLDLTTRIIAQGS